MTAPKFTPWKVGGRVGSTAREGLVGLYAIDREKPNKYQGNAVAYAHSLDDARVCAAAPDLYAALEATLYWTAFAHDAQCRVKEGVEYCDCLIARDWHSARAALGKAGPHG